MKLRLNRFYDSHANEFLNASLKKMSSVESAQVFNPLRLQSAELLKTPLIEKIINF